MSYAESSATDFTKEDHGKWKPPVLDGDLTYAELKKRVFAAIGKPGEKIASRTLGQIKLHAGLPAGFDLSPIIEGMLIDHEIRNESNGTITAFFRYADKPERFHLTGDRQVEAEFIENYHPDPIKTDEQLLAEERIERRSETMPDEPGKKKSRQARALDTAQVEELAATLPTQAEIADKLGISVSWLTLKFKENPDIRAAYERGRVKYAEANAATPYTRQPKPEPTHPVTLHKRVNRDQPDLDPAEVERLAATGATAKQAAEALGLTVFVFKNRIAKGKGTDAAIRDAWYRGVETAKANGVKPNRGPRPVKSDPPPRRRDAEVKKAVNKPLDSSTPKPVNTEATGLTGEPANLTQAVKPLDSSTPEPVNTEATGLTGEPANPTQTEEHIPTPADICSNCLSDLPEDTTLWFPFFPNSDDADECWQFCSDDCRRETVRSGQMVPAFEGEIIGFNRGKASEIFDRFAAETLEAAAKIDEYHRASDNETRDLANIPASSASEDRNGHAGVTVHDARQRVQSRYITFEDGSQLLVGFEGNFFEMTPDDRKLLDAIAGMVQSYPEGVRIETKTSQIAEFTQDKRSLWQRIRAVFG